MGLADDAKEARAQGLSYGQWRLMQPKKGHEQAQTPPPKNRKTKKYTDELLFELWQQGKTDAEIGAIVKVSRAMIQKWRSNMELPSTSQSGVDPWEYSLIETEYGIYAVTEDD